MVVLFEMATGAAPKFGDGLSDPASVRDEATVEAALFDPAVAGGLGLVLRNGAGPQRQGTPRHRRRDARRVAFGVRPGPQDHPRQRGRMRRRGGTADPAGRGGAVCSGPVRVGTLRLGHRLAGNLVAVDPVRLNRLSGVAEATRREVKARARQWRDEFGSAVTGRGPRR